MKKIVIYARVSTIEQNIDSQLEAVKKYCASQDWNVIKIYQDIGISGGQDIRPALDELKKDCSKNKFDAIVVFKFDRMARSSSHLLECLNLFRTYHKDFVSVTENIDTGTSIGKMIFTFLSAISEFEKELIKERVKAGITRAQSAGIHCGRPRRGIDISEALRLKNQGLGYKQISKKLGVPRSTVFRYLSSLVSVKKQ